MVSLRKERKIEQRIRCRWKSRANGNKCDLWDVYSVWLPHLFLRAWFAQLRPMMWRKSEKRKRNVARTSHAGAPIIRRILDYLFISQRFPRTRRYSTCSQNLVSLVDEKRSKKYFCIEEAEECTFTDYLFSRSLQKGPRKSACFQKIK